MNQDTKPLFEEEIAEDMSEIGSSTDAVEAWHNTQSISC